MYGISDWIGSPTCSQAVPCKPCPSHLRGGESITQHGFLWKAVLSVPLGHPPSLSDLVDSMARAAGWSLQDFELRLLFAPKYFLD